MNNKEVRKYVLIGAFLVLLFASYLIVKPFINTLLAAFILAYIFHPWYKKLNKRVKSEYLSAFLVTLLAVIIIVLPLVVIANLIIKEALAAYSSDLVSSASNLLETTIHSQPELNQVIGASVERGVAFVANAAGGILVSIPARIFHFLIAIYAFFYLLITGETVVKKVKQTFPFQNKEKLFTYLGETTYGVIYGIFLIAVVEFIIASIGFWLIGVPSPLLWAVLVGILGLIPFLGPGILWIPYTIIAAILGLYTLAVGMLIVGVTLTLTDTFARGFVIGKKIKMHPVMIVIGVVGGVGVFGVIGLVVGPLLLSFLTVIIEGYYDHHSTHAKHDPPKLLEKLKE